MGEEKKMDEKTVQGITIDGIDSRDLDDAVHLASEEGKYIVTVSIADVASAVEQNGERDQEAYRQAFTLYRAWGNKTMLPPVLAEDKCSLLPNQPRNVIAIRVTLSSELEIESTDVERATLTSAAKLAYPDIDDIIAGRLNKHSNQKAMLSEMASLARCLLEKRRQNGALAIYDINRGWAITEEGSVIALQSDEKTVGYVIIQELMILANRAVAAWLTERNMPCLYRCHRARVSAPASLQLTEDVRQAFQNPDLFSIETAMQRVNLVMDKAYYSPLNGGHYGLNLPVYMHFTSPIRRYADLVNHRAVHALLDGRESPYSPEELSGIGAHLTERTNAERAKTSAEWKKTTLRQAARALNSPAETLAALDGKRFYQSLKVAASKDEPSETITEAIRQRISQGTITDKEMFYVLFECPNTPQWREFHPPILKLIAAQKHKAVSLLAMGETLRGWQPVRYARKMNGARFIYRAQIKWGDKDSKQGAWADALTSKEARQSAAFELIVALCEPAESVSIPVAEKSVTPLGEAVQSVQLQLEAGNFVGALYEVCGKTGSQPPSFEASMNGSPQAPSATTTARVSINGQEFEVTESAQTKKMAKSLAARSLLMQMSAQAKTRPS